MSSFRYFSCVNQVFYQQGGCYDSYNCRNDCQQHDTDGEQEFPCGGGESNEARVYPAIIVDVVDVHGESHNRTVEGECPKTGNTHVCVFS